MSAHQEPHVVFGVDFRMQHRPVVRRADEGQAAAEKLEAPNADRMNQGAPGSFTASGLDEHHRGTGENRIFQFGARDPGHVSIGAVSPSRSA